VLSTSLLAAALLANAATAADQAPAAKPASGPVSKPAAKAASGPVADALQSALRELQQAQDPRLPLPAQLDSLAAMRYTPETAAKLRAVFGNEQPFTVERQSAPAGRLAYRARLQPLHYAGADGSRVDWDEALFDLDMDQAGKTVGFTGGWKLFTSEETAVRLSVEDITFSGRQSRSHDKLWFGDGKLRAARVRGTNKADGSAVTLDDLRFDWRTVERPKAVDMAFQYRIGAIEAAGEKVEDVRFDVRMVNIDRASMVALQAASERQRKQTNAMTPEQRAEAMKPLLLGFGKSAIVRGSALEIDEISARYRGNKASIRGRIGLVGAVEADLQDMKKLVKKIVARFEIRVPVAMVRDIAGVVATRQAAQQGAAPNPMGAAQVGQTMTDVVIGKLVGGGFARIENEELVSNLEFRNGELTANGKKVELPKGAPAGTPPVAVQRPGLPPNALKARRIEESCRLPDFPDEVLAQDKPLRAGFTWRVDPEGKVENLRVTAPSGHPAWDQTMIEVLGQCRYIPALQDGKPVGMQINWNVARTVGGPRSPTPSP
jgi:uncharacterized protein YdgA (DUF945 family)